MTEALCRWPLSDAFLQALMREFPGFRLVPKDRSPLCRAIDVALRVITLGGQRRFLSHYHTVIGNALYVSRGWPLMSDVDRLILLRHERVHLLQRRRYGFVPFALLYLIPFVPLGLAYFRARLEWEAYRETLRATLELRGPGALRSAALRAELVRRFTSADYGWMWPFPTVVGRWYDQAVAELGAPAAPDPDHG